MTADNEQHDYNEWLKHKGELDPEDQRYTWPGQKFPMVFKVLATLLGAGLAAIAIWRWGR